MDMLGALAAGVGVGAWYVLFQALEGEEPAYWRQYGRGPIEQAAHWLGRLWARCHKATK